MPRLTPVRYIFEHPDSLCVPIGVSAFGYYEARRALAAYVKEPNAWMLIGTDDYANPADARRNAKASQ